RQASRFISHMICVPAYPFLLRYTLLLSHFFYPDLSAPENYTLSLHDALPICFLCQIYRIFNTLLYNIHSKTRPLAAIFCPKASIDRKSTRLNSSHVSISYAVFCLKKKKDITSTPTLYSIFPSSQRVTYSVTCS